MFYGHSTLALIQCDKIWKRFLHRGTKGSFVRKQHAFILHKFQRNWEHSIKLKLHGWNGQQKRKPDKHSSNGYTNRLFWKICENITVLKIVLSCFSILGWVFFGKAEIKVIFNLTKCMEWKTSISKAMKQIYWCIYIVNSEILLKCLFELFVYLWLLVSLSLSIEIEWILRNGWISVCNVW